MSESVAVVEATGFAALGLDTRLVDALVGYSEPSPIQREAIPVVLQGRDLVGLAGTGTGKTAAFALPLIHQLHHLGEQRRGVGVLILTPTRELAIQVAKAIKTYGKPVGIEVSAIYGGTGYSEQLHAIRRGFDVIVATPGRALDLIKRGKFPMDDLQAVVLDEADEMLDMGFADDIDAILSETPETRQTLLFSATMPPRIEEIAKKHLKNPVRIKVAREVPAAGQEAKVRQTAYLVKREHKIAALGRILTLEKPTSAIIFCRTRTESEELTEMLSQRDFHPLALHGGMSQEQRDRAMKQFREGSADLLVATDIAARGLDISHLSHVVNYDVPTQAEAYVHRIGRVGRAGRAGVAITLVTPREQGALWPIERELKTKIEFAQVPTVKDLRAARLEATVAKMREALTAPSITNEMRAALGELQTEFTPEALALAALQMLSQPARPDDDRDIPTASNKKDAPRSNGYDDRRPRGGDRGGFDGGRRPDRGGDERRRAGSRPTGQGMAKVFFGVGRDAGVTQRDIVGAIANEAGIPGRDLGFIDLTDRFALVEVPEDVAEYVVEAMQGVRIRGRKVNVRPDRPPRG